MGNLTNGKGGDHGRSYYEYQLSLFRWRADPNHNAYLPRVHFSPRSQQLQRQRFTHIMEQQLQQHVFVDVDALKTIGSATEGEVIVFQQFAARLSDLEGALQVGECIYTLVGLMQGYERILARLGRTHIELAFCFVTMEGEVRAWLSDNPASNDLPGEIQMEIGREVQKLHVFSSEAGVIKRLIELNRRLSTGNNREYFEFSEEVKKFVRTNMLQNCNFSAVRRFINRYLFIHGLTLPYSLAKALQRSKVVRFQSAASEQEVQNQEMSNIATRGQLSTQAQLDFLQPPQQQQLRKCNSSNIKPEVPQINVESKMIVVDPSCRTPKTDTKYNPLDSTFINSQLLLSRQKGKENLRKGQSFHKSKNQLERPRQRGHQARFSQTHPTFLKKQKGDGNTTSAKVSVKFHSRQPSLDQQSNSMFISPANQKVDFGVHYSYVPQCSNPSLKQKQSKGERQRCDEAFSNLPSNAQKSTSQLLARQVSGLVSNRDLSICESLGTFQSIDNSKDSGYMGVLTKMGRTAKMVNLPTGKRLATFFWNGESHPHLTQ